MDVHEWFDEIREKWGVPKKLEELESLKPAAAAVAPNFATADEL